MVIVNLKLALICFLGQCYPALVGDSTPTGTYTLTKRVVMSPGYGGDVLQFKETEKDIFAIHRVWTLRPAQRRMERLLSGNVVARKSITNGCVNILPEVYDKLMSCCQGQTLEIVK